MAQRDWLSDQMCNANASACRCDPPGAPIGNDGYELCFITSDMAQAGTAGPELLGRDSQIVKISGRFVNLAAIEATVQVRAASAAP